MPTAVVTLPSIGRICYADAGLHAKIECADMDGTHREVGADSFVELLSYVTFYYLL